MPGRDGTGPKGKGPMTGICSGSCILRIPDNTDEQINGWSHLAGIGKMKGRYSTCRVVMEQDQLGLAPGQAG